MIINDLLKEYGAKFTIDSNGVDNEINPIILPKSKVIKNDGNEFILHKTDEDGSLFELIVRLPNTVIYNYYAPDGEIYMSHSYSDEGFEIGN